jgi:ATP-dependent Clp protease ATP-binding subunit ClpC
MQRTLNDSLKRAFRPEFLNRVDGVIVFRSLTRDEIRQIVDLEVEKVAKRLTDHAIKLALTPEARDLLGELGYDPDMGARPLRRIIQAKVEDTLSDEMLAGKVPDGETVSIEARDKEIVLTPQGDAPLPLPEPEAEALPTA